MLIPGRSREGFRRLYNWYHEFYGSVERALGPSIDVVVEECIRALPGRRSKTALEYACGSGLLTLKIAPLFRSLAAKDLSTGMLERARRRAADLGVQGVSFTEGDLLDPGEPAKSVDFIFVSFALHLYHPDQVVEILRRLGRIAREAIVVLDHPRKWSFGSAVVERLEGSHYGQFIRTDFAAAATAADLRLADEREIESCLVLTFHPAP